jgi:hypothetical protein
VPLLLNCASPVTTTNPVSLNSLKARAADAFDIPSASPARRDEK